MNFNLRRAEHHIKMQKLYYFLNEHRFISERRFDRAYKRHSSLATMYLTNELESLKETK